EPGIAIRERIGDDVRRRVGDAVERRLRRGEMPRRLGGVGLKLAAGDGEVERGHFDLFAMANSVPLLPSSAEVGFIRLRPTYERPNLGKPKFGCESGDPYSRGGGYGSPA